MTPECTDPDCPLARPHPNTPGFHDPMSASGPSIRELILAKVVKLRPWATGWQGCADFTKLSDAELVDEFTMYVRWTFSQR
jgi:hypothetical protein